MWFEKVLGQISGVRVWSVLIAFAKLAWSTMRPTLTNTFSQANKTYFRLLIDKMYTKNGFVSIIIQFFCIYFVRMERMFVRAVTAVLTIAYTVLCLKIFIQFCTDADDDTTEEWSQHSDDQNKRWATMIRVWLPHIIKSAVVFSRTTRTHSGGEVVPRRISVRLLA